MGSGTIWLPLSLAALIVLFVFARFGGPRVRALTIALSIGALIAFTLSGCGGDYDPGGSVVAASARALDARKGGAGVKMRGTYLSVGALRLASGPGLCVAPGSWIGVHEARDALSAEQYGRGTRDNLMTGYVRGMLPRCARELFDARHGFDSGRLVVLSGTEILGACPTIRACDG